MILSIRSADNITVSAKNETLTVWIIHETKCKHSIIMNEVILLLLLYLSSVCSTENLEKKSKKMYLYLYTYFKVIWSGQPESRSARTEPESFAAQCAAKTFAARSAGGAEDDVGWWTTQSPMRGRVQRLIHCQRRSSPDSGEVNIRFPSQGTPLDSRFFGSVIGDSFAVAPAPIWALLDRNFMIHFDEFCSFLELL